MSALASCAKTVFLQRDRMKSHSSITFYYSSSTLSE